MTEAALVRNAADPEQVREAGRKAKSRRVTELDDVRQVLSTRRGRRFVWKYLSECGIFRTSFGGGTDLTAFREGARNVGLQLLRDVNDADPAAYSAMLSEDAKEDSTDDQE